MLPCILLNVNDIVVSLAGIVFILTNPPLFLKHKSASHFILKQPELEQINFHEGKP